MEWEIRGNYGHGWEAVYTASSKEEARQILADYRENERGISFIVKAVRA